MPDRITHEELAQLQAVAERARCQGEVDETEDWPSLDDLKEWLPTSEFFHHEDFLHIATFDPPTVLRLLGEVERLRESKDGAYEERNRLVAALSKLFPAHLAKHPEDDETWERDWMTIVCIHLPTGQATWHVHDSERHLFDHLGEGDNHWDGHSTEEKYSRIARLEDPTND